MRDDIIYSEIPPRAAGAIKGFATSPESLSTKVAMFSDVIARAPDADGDVELLHGVCFVHHSIDAPGDYETIKWHYVECGSGEPIVLLHGIPDSWYQWHHEMAVLSRTHRCIAIDLKGYGQSGTSPGDYRHEGVAGQLVAMLEQIGITAFNLVSHDRGTALADFIAANHVDRVLRYGRGEQHLYHYNPDLAPQGELLRDAPYNGMLNDPGAFVVSAYASLAIRPVPEEEMRRLIQEFSYPGITRAIPRYYGANSFRQEWLARRTRLLAAWTCPVLIMQGYDSRTQPREFYEHVRDYIPNARDVQLRFIPGGHFWPMESPVETAEAIQHLLTM